MLTMMHEQRSDLTQLKREMDELKSMMKALLSSRLATDDATSGA